MDADVGDLRDLLYLGPEALGIADRLVRHIAGPPVVAAGPITLTIWCRPQPVELPANLPELYRQHVTDLVTTLSDESVAGDAGDELRTMIDRITVRHDPVAGHGIELEGKIVELLQAGSRNAKGPAGGGAYAGARSSLELVAGAGFEPAAFRL